MKLTYPNPNTDCHLAGPHTLRYIINVLLEVRCPLPSRLPHVNRGELIPAAGNPEDGGIYYADQWLFHCDSGYEANGKETFLSRCTEKGIWSYHPQGCTGKR